MMTMKISTTSNRTPCPSVREVCAWLADYCAWLLGCGSTCIRLEKNVRRIAQAYGKEVEITIMPRHIHLSVWQEEERADAVTVVVSVCHAAGISFNINTRLSELSWEIADRGISLAAARRRMNAIVGHDPRNRWLELLLVTLANASFCRLFGGDAVAMAITGVATAAGYHLKLVLLGHGVDLRVTMLACSFASAVLGATGVLFSCGTTPMIALATSVLYLVPGIPFLNSFSDMLYRHYICAFSRFMDAVVLTGCLSIGLCAGMMLMDVGMF